MLQAMRRSKDAAFGNRFVCAFLRLFVLFILAFVALGLYLAARGSSSPGDALMLLVLGSLLAFFAQVFGDFSGAYSRLAVLNTLVHIYSMVFLPAAGVFIISRLAVGSFKEAFASSLAAAFFLAVYCAARNSRRERDALTEVPTAAATAAA